MSLSRPPLTNARPRKTGARAFLGLVGLLALGVSQADTYPASTGWTHNGGHAVFATALEAATAAYDAAPATFQGYTKARGPFVTGCASTNFQTYSGIAYIGRYYNGSEACFNTSGTLTNVYYCPQGGTLSGNTCTRPDCTASQTRDANGVCRDNCPAGTTWSATIGGCACPL